MTKRRFVADGGEIPRHLGRRLRRLRPSADKRPKETAGGGEELETDTEVGSTEEERDEAHAIRPEKGPRNEHTYAGAA